MQQGLRALGCERPNDGPLVTMGSANGQKRQDLWAMMVLKPLVCCLAMRRLGLDATRQCMLGVLLQVKCHTQFITGLAGTALTNNGQRCGHGQRALFNQGLEPNSGGQVVFQGGYIHHPVEGLHALGRRFKFEQAALIALNVHFQNGRACMALGPAA